MPIHCRQARPEDFPAGAQLLELYQHDLSDIWLQDLDAQGRYGYDLTPHQHAQRFFAHVARQGAQYVSVGLVAPAAVTRTDGHWMEQFLQSLAHLQPGASHEPRTPRFQAC